MEKIKKIFEKIKYKEFFKEIKYKELFKLIFISFLIIYAILSIKNTIYRINEFQEINEMIGMDADMDISDKEYKPFENYLMSIEEDITYRQNDAKDGTYFFAYYEKNYPNAMFTLDEKGELISEQAFILIKSVFFGICVGIIFYIYKNTSKVLWLIIKYLILYVVAWIDWEYAPSIDIVSISVNKYGGYFFYGAGIYFDEYELIGVFVVLLLLISIKIIKNKIIINKLNSFTKKDH